MTVKAYYGYPSMRTDVLIDLEGTHYQVRVSVTGRGSVSVRVRGRARVRVRGVGGRDRVRVTGCYHDLCVRRTLSHTLILTIALAFTPAPT